MTTSSSSLRCIYCLETKAATDFDAEHVVPQSFGKFERNLVLGCVCRSCNAHFGRVLDEKLACDSLEGRDRFRTGLKKPSQFRSLGKRSALHVRVSEDGPLKGAYGHYVPDSENMELKVTYMPQVGFAKSRGEPFTWYRIDNIPSKEELTAQGYGPEMVVRTEGIAPEEAQDALVTKGFKRGTLEEKYEHPDRRMHAEAVVVIDSLHLRGIAKIAFNYFTAIEGQGIALMPQFNDIRRYIRDDVQPEQPVVAVDEQPWEITNKSDGQPSKGHYIAVHRAGSRILAQVSLLLRLRYSVVLSSAPFILPYSPSFGSFFDIDNRRISDVRAAALFIGA